MPRLLPSLLLAVALLPAPSLLMAQNPPAAPAEPIVEPGLDAAVATAAPPAAAPVLTPLMQEITAAWKVHEVVAAALEQQLAAATDATAALALQRQLEAARAQVEVEILAIQARQARRDGRLDAAAELEAVIGQLTSPPARGIPAPRERETH